MWNANDLCQLDRCMVLQAGLDLDGGDILTTDLEHIPQAAVKHQLAIRRRWRSGPRNETSLRRSRASAVFIG